ncbi:response regulator transcription factor [Enterococcus sp. BWR-S5]|uniref:response regulator transcription factor n=1 Tax=Enterococcus sp. BWR-S5 TaxID=2787714 RepID=UPI0019228CAE|nr:response regulator transcription factor [Enterococcus sp. BWR-S5]MBL1226146.1 response regulator transcription factor [Enterococcus sp. BWR-S5]
MTSILIIDDDCELGRLLAQCLTKEGYYVQVAEDGEKGLALAESEAFQLIVLDVMLPKLSGFDVLQQIRQSSFVPILMLTAKEHEADKVSGLRLGADDYLTKPFSIQELIARIESHIRRSTRFNTAVSLEGVQTIGAFKLEPALHSIKVNDVPLALTDFEYRLLSFFMAHKNQVFTKQQLYQQVWKEPYLDSDNTVMACISRLRLKIRQAAPKQEAIETVWGVGYRFKGAR